MPQESGNSELTLRDPALIYRVAETKYGRKRSKSKGKQRNCIMLLEQNSNTEYHSDSDFIWQSFSGLSMDRPPDAITRYTCQ